MVVYPENFVPTCPLVGRSSFILPVSLETASAWALGWVDDIDVLGATDNPGAVFIVTLPNLCAWRAVLPSLVDYYRRGARAVILRTQTPAVVHHVAKWGGVRTVKDPSGAWRYWVGPDSVDRYFGRIAQKAVASSGVTNSR